MMTNLLSNLKHLFSLLFSLLMICIIFAWMLFLMLLMLPTMLLAMPYTLYTDCKYEHGRIPEHWSTIPYLRTHAFLVKYGMGMKQIN